MLAALRGLRRKGLVAKGTYHDFMSLILSARTHEQLQEIAVDFAEILSFNRRPVDRRADGKRPEAILDGSPVLVMGDEILPLRGTRRQGEI